MDAMSQEIYARALAEEESQLERHADGAIYPRHANAGTV